MLFVIINESGALARALKLFDLNLFHLLFNGTHFLASRKFIERTLLCDRHYNSLLNESQSQRTKKIRFYDVYDGIGWHDIYWG